MRPKTIILTALTLSPFGHIAAKNQENSRPNVIIVITDDQGKNDLGCEGNSYIKTPNVDKFHEQSVRLTNYHVSTTSAPSRGAIMTGRHTNRLNVYHTIMGRSLLYEDEVTIADILSQNGYTNGLFGKWHLGDNYPFRPIDRGFHEVVCLGGGGIGQAPDYWGNDYFDDTYLHNGEAMAYKGYCTDVFFDCAMDFIEENKDNPFFCYISTNAPHGPLNLPKEYLDIYKDADIADTFKRFYGMITNIDDNFARLEKKLKQLGLRENTIVIFTTDNGTAGGFRVHDAGMKGGKGSVYEGGHRVPFYIRWPAGNIEGGRDMERLVAHYDLLPTFVDILNLKSNPKKRLDGVSLKPLLYGDEQGWSNRILYMDTQREVNLTKRKNYVVMDDNWRLVNGVELYDINNDLIQKNNVIDQHPEVAGRLSEGYERWWQSIMSEKPDERYAYIKAGSPYENPMRITTHDIISPDYGGWNQRSVAGANQVHGHWKIEFVTDGEYKISLCRFPRESGLAINATFPAQEPNVEIDSSGMMPSSTKSDFTDATLYFSNISKKAKIEPGATEVSFTANNVVAGKYDLFANLVDKNGRRYAPYYIYIEKID